MTTWSIPRMWEGGECWIIGGGPSMPLEFGVPKDVIEGVLSGDLPLSAYSPFLSPIHDKHVMGINVAFLLGEWVDVVHFGDGGFYLANKALLDAFPKVKVTCHPEVIKRKDVFDVKYVPRAQHHPRGISDRGRTVSWNLNSGACGINLAYWLGVKLVYLLGFDMNVVEGVQHWHRHYAKDKTPKARDPKKLPFKRHLECFPMIAKDAARLGMEIINVSPNSKIESFKRVKLSDVL